MKTKVWPSFFIALFIALLFFGCSSDSSVNISEESSEFSLVLQGCKNYSIDKKSKTVTLDLCSDSLTIDSVYYPLGAFYYLTLDSDMVDPSIDWDNLIKQGSVVTFDSTLHVAVLDSLYRVLSVIVLIKSKKSDSIYSSSSEYISSSSYISEGENSSSSKTVLIESSSAFFSSSSALDELSSSSEIIEIIESSSSFISRVYRNELSVENGTITVNDLNIYIELPYGSDLTQIKIEPLDSILDLTYSHNMDLLDDEGVLNTYTVVAGVQLPGTDFDARHDFWATTSDAMATSATASLITMKSFANVTFENLNATLSSKIITASSLGVTGGKKLSGGFYYAGTFEGSDCSSLYNADGGYPGLEDSDFSVSMKFGQPFTARPKAISVTYAYNHIEGDNENYPQKSLIYALLVSADNKVVATASIIDSASVEYTTKEVPFAYGSDPYNLLSGEYALEETLSLGDGNESVAYIHVLFASSAYAHIASTSYRGGVSSELILDAFKLIY